MLSPPKTREFVPCAPSTDARDDGSRLLGRVATASTDSMSTCAWKLDTELHQSKSLRLQDLPNELLSHIIDYLDTQCPSDVNWNQRPEKTLTQSTTLDLKTISCVSNQFRHLILPRLFTHTRIDPSHTTSFLAFLANNALTDHISSLVAHLSGPCTHLHPHWWSRLLDTLPITTFTVLCPPYVFAELAQTSLVDTDSWVFNMPYHTIRFRQESPCTPFTSGSQANFSQPSLLTYRPWTHFSVNESSSLKAYSQYEYFLRKTPSLLSALHNMNPQPYSCLLSNLTHFTYTAIFPFYNHVDTILKSVRLMPRLTHFTTKVCPEPESSVVEDELALALGHIDLNDAWMEFDTVYTLVAHTVIYLGLEGVLEEFRVDDVKMEGIRENLEEVLSQRLQEWWNYAGAGVWRRKERKKGEEIEGERQVHNHVSIGEVSTAAVV